MWASGFRPDRRQYSPAPGPRTGARTQTPHHLGRVHSSAQGSALGHRLLYHRSLDRHWPDHCLRPVLPSIANAQGHPRWPHPLSQRSLLKQLARNLTTEDGPMAHARFLLHDRDTKFSQDFDALFQSAGIEALKLPPQSPNLNAFAERWVRSVKEECLDQLILFGERSLRHALQEYLAHHQHERNHQGLNNVIPFPDQRTGAQDGTIRKSERLGGLLNFYHRAA